MSPSWAACCDELEKIAIKVPFIHGTSGRWKELAPAVGAPNLASDPNARAVYTAMKARAKVPGIENFARESQRRRGGEAVVAHGKMDTAKGWAPFNLTPWGKKNVGTAEDARELVNELETAKGPRRGEIWRTLHSAVGSWRNDDLGASLRPAGYRAVGQLQKSKAA